MEVAEGEIKYSVPPLRYNVTLPPGHTEEFETCTLGSRVYCGMLTKEFFITVILKAGKIIYEYNVPRVQVI